jgi:hypothetical protein
MQKTGEKVEKTNYPIGKHKWGKWNNCTSPVEKPVECVNN